MVVAAGLLIAACGAADDSGSPLAAPPTACLGVPQGPCDDAIASMEGSFGSPVVRAIVSCTVVVCTPADGEVQIDLLLADGRRESSGYGYGSAEPQPVPINPPLLTVVPVCLGVAFPTCKDMAENALQGAGGTGPGVRPPIVQITVRCNGVCTPTAGQGETRIDYADGTYATSSWGYTSHDG